MVDSNYLHWVCSVPVGATIAIFGLIGNIFSVYVWNRVIKSKLRGSPSTAIYLISLAVCDGGLLLFSLFTDTIPSNLPSVKKTYKFAAFFSWFGFPLFFFFLVASIWMVVGVTINRYVMISLPTRVRVLYSNVRLYAGIIGILIFSFVINIPHFFNYHPMKINTTYVLVLTEYGKSDGSKNYEFWVHCIVLVLVPWFTIAILNALIVFRLTKQMQKFLKDKDKKNGRRYSHERQMTIMLLTVTFLFLILLAWQCVTQCFYMLEHGKDDGIETATWDYVNKSFALAKLGVVINSSINFVLYCLTGTTFRKEVLKIIKSTRVHAIRHSVFKSYSSKSGAESNSTSLGLTNISKL